MGAILPKGRLTNNFGDLIGPEVVRTLVGNATRSRPGDRRLLAVGSILHFAEDDDVVWGSGINGKIPLSQIRAIRLDVRAVRGPLTADVLRKRGVAVPDVFGDPALLYPALNDIKRATPTRPLTIVPNLHDEETWRHRAEALSPRLPIREVVATIAQSEFVAASSLHGLVIADALGVPASMLQPSKEDLFKYQDYYEGTGRRMPKVCATIAETLDQPADLLRWSPTSLIDAFPHDLWVEGSLPSGT
ncbi:polysaccharide pyruvyl transferase family protein [Microbacterium oleivorans]|uniref:polysaccharide pyruvyl transferase family protein n=1 Tax=Microbacterium oleivorans TaxID=273677 RepID=UPI002041FCAD|nr:polysaccharide pyruvyl transferase family protein [Microbacterium oleivorans]MCM3697157.1 polysaccharide pyruvyl transferase family protein [Microbacterium oleivorans]